jgi:hypothetical protein
MTVELVAGDIALLQTINAAKVLAGGNLCLIGSGAIGWEYVSVQTITADPGGDTWTLSGIIRGRRGTEYLTKAYPVGTDVYFFSPQTFLRIAPAVAAINTTLSFTSVGIGQEISEGESVAPTLVGHALKPFAPAHPRLISGTWGSPLTIAFAPRVRGAYNWPDNEALAGFPYDEVPAFEVDIISAGGAVLRTLTTSIPQFNYSSAHQVLDFPSGNPLELKLRIYQIGLYGRGYSNLNVVQV